MTSRGILVATRNKGKAEQLGLLLAEINLQLWTLDEAKVALEVAETGSTYRENALLKARQYARASGMVTIADDSGLEVDALGGLPGVKTARFGGQELTDEQRYRYLLDQLLDVPTNARSARFRSVVALVGPADLVEITEGVCEGIIATEPAGSAGFGYDPVFFLPDRQLTMAQLPPAVKNKISHRGRAVTAMIPHLRRLFVNQN